MPEPDTLCSSCCVAPTLQFFICKIKITITTIALLQGLDELITSTKWSLHICMCMCQHNANIITEAKETRLLGGGCAGAYTRAAFMWAT